MTKQQILEHALTMAYLRAVGVLVRETSLPFALYETLRPKLQTEMNRLTIELRRDLEVAA